MLLSSEQLAGRKRYLIIVLCCLLVVVGCGRSSTEVEPASQVTRAPVKPVPENAAELERIARLANGGALGCGLGTYTFVYLDGTEKTIQSGLDPIHVFGSRIHAKNLLNLLQARAASNRSGTGPMAGERDSLLFVVLSTLGESAEPGSIVAVVEMLQDPSEVARAWAKIALIRTGEQRVDLQQEIMAEIRASGVDISKISSRGEDVPDWMGKAVDQGIP